MIKFEICLGSSCYARGNRRALELLEEHVQENNLADDVALSGRLCLGDCACGPHILVDGIKHDLIAPEEALEILGRMLAEKAGKA